MIRQSMLVLAAALGATPAAAQPPAHAPNYSKPSTWLCLPGRSDNCSKPLPTTALNPNGYGSNGPSPVARDPSVDCFYVYPTVSLDQGMNSDLVPNNAETSAVQSQFARFAGACRPFAPIYRQMTVAAVTAVAAGADYKALFAKAYGDVRAAWKEYLTKYNKGRPFVLVGHSQGSWMLQTLIAKEIEGKPVAGQMKLAIIPGFNVLVPQGKLVGGTFRSTPICSKPGQTGCVMTWVSFRERNSPPNGAIFGWTSQSGMTIACSNPARPGSGAWERLDSYWDTRSGWSVPGGPIIWSTQGSPPTRFLRTEGLASARCVNRGPLGYLEIRTNADPRDKRTDRIGGEVGILGFFLPGWGMHLADMQAAMGNLVRTIESLGSSKR